MPLIIKLDNKIEVTNHTPDFLKKVKATWLPLLSKTSEHDNKTYFSSEKYSEYEFYIHSECDFLFFNKYKNEYCYTIKVVSFPPEDLIIDDILS